MRRELNGYVECALIDLTAQKAGPIPQKLRPLAQAE
jgi:hypothetical protein